MNSFPFFFDLWILSKMFAFQHYFWVDFTFFPHTSDTLTPLSAHQQHLSFQQQRTTTEKWQMETEIADDKKKWSCTIQPTCGLHDLGKNESIVTVIIGSWCSDITLNFDKALFKTIVTNNIETSALLQMLKFEKTMQNARMSCSRSGALSCSHRSILMQRQRRGLDSVA